MQGRAVPFVTREIAESLVARSLPSLREQQDSFIRWLGDKLRANNPAERYSIAGKDSDEFCAVIGAFSVNYAWQIVRDLNAAGLVEWDSAPTNIVRITTAGWDRYEEMERAPSAARLAFMAMPFKNSQLDQVFKQCFKPAVYDTGFELRRLDEGQPAGLIDDQLRVRIRTSWFLVAELTTENRGVYWEAGFAEGLGRPVIYTCQESKSKELQTHFDTNHHLTVVWEPDKFAEAGEKLKATIRAT
jgi:hypothetical protein